MILAHGKSKTRLQQVSAFDNSPQLRQLEKQLAKFNFFESIGAVRKELRHSDFLKFLLDPRESHGLGDTFLKRLYAELASRFPRIAPFPVKKFIGWNLGDLDVRREWENIDIFIVCESRRFVVIIENKIDSPERGDQLSTYWQRAERAYPNFTIWAIYLTPSGDPPGNRGYLALSYNVVRGIVEKIARDWRGKAQKDLLTALTHYTRMIRRHLVKDSVLFEHCRKIYRKHKQAIKLILDSADEDDTLHRFLQVLIEESPKLESGHHRRGFVQFRPLRWDRLSLRASKFPVTQFLFFEFQYSSDHLDLFLVINKKTAKRDGPPMFEIAKGNSPPFRVISKNLVQWTRVFGLNILKANDFDELEFPQRKQKIKRHWSKFLTEDLPQIGNVVMRNACSETITSTKIAASQL